MQDSDGRYFLQTEDVKDSDMLFFNYKLEFDYLNRVRVQNSAGTHDNSVPLAVNNKTKENEERRN